jgi:hypothetical protein
MIVGSIIGWRITPPSVGTTRPPLIHVTLAWTPALEQLLRVDEASVVEDDQEGDQQHRAVPQHRAGDRLDDGQQRRERHDERQELLEGCLVPGSQLVLEGLAFRQRVPPERVGIRYRLVPYRLLPRAT